MTPEQLEVRIAALLDTCTYTVFNYTRRGLFDRDKLIVLTLLTFQILLRSGSIDVAEYDALCKGARSTAPPPVTDDLSRSGNWLASLWAANSATHDTCHGLQLGAPCALCSAGFLHMITWMTCTC
jgi:dynein heavy chain